MDIHVDLDMPQPNWPDDPKTQQRFLRWLVEFDALYERGPTVPEMLEWAYQEGINDAKGEPR